MDISAVRAVALEANFAAHGIDVSVQLPNEEPVDAVGIWLTPINEDMPTSAPFSGQRPNRVIALRRSEVPSLPRGARITAPEQSGGDSRVWFVDGVERDEADHHRVHVVLDAEATEDLAAEDEA